VCHGTSLAAAQRGREGVPRHVGPGVVNHSEVVQAPQWRSLPFVADDLADLARLMHRFLRAVSFEKGQQPAYVELRDLFVEGGTLIRAISAEPEISTVDEFIRPRQEMVDSGALEWFEEVEVADITEIFGNVAHRFSTYEKRGTMNGTAIDARGAISTQFVRTPDGWRMSAMAWDDERPGLSLPARYAT
jgi:hypothetical protein